MPREQDRLWPNLSRERETINKLTKTRRSFTNRRSRRCRMNIIQTLKCLSQNRIVGFLWYWTLSTSMKRRKIPFDNLDESIAWCCTIRDTKKQRSRSFLMMNSLNRSFHSLNELIGMSEKIRQHFQKRSSLEDERGQGNFCQIHWYASLGVQIIVISQVEESHVRSSCKHVVSIHFLIDPKRSFGTSSIHRREMSFPARVVCCHQRNVRVWDPPHPTCSSLDFLSGADQMTNVSSKNVDSLVNTGSGIEMRSKWSRVETRDRFFRWKLVQSHGNDRLNATLTLM